MPPTAVPTSEASKPLRIALIGNPNTGKSTVFNALAGMGARTGNYPGVTVEKKVGKFAIGSQPVELVDLPGTYSLAPRSPDEIVAVDVLTGDTSISEPIDAIVCVVSATLLQRNLFLVSQILELGKPVVVVVNMMDIADSRGLQIDANKLSETLGVPVIPTVASKRQGIDELRDAILHAARVHGDLPARSPLPETFYAARDRLQAGLRTLTPQEAANHDASPSECTTFDRYIVERAILDLHGAAEQRLCRCYGDQALSMIADTRKELGEQLGDLIDVECKARYEWSASMLEGVVGESKSDERNWSDRIDTVLTHRVFGLVLFAALMFAVFQVITTLAGWPMDKCEQVQELVSGLASSVLPPGILRSLVIDGVIAGVGGVLIFLPQIALLFFFIALLEDCGYMARAAFLVDRVMCVFGLSGKSFLPLMSSFACAVPGVMATRVIENRRDRFATIMVAPLMSCSARLPVYLLLIAAFVPAASYAGGWITLHGLVLMSMYFVGIVAAIPVAWILKKTVLSGEPAPFVLELPDYKLPSIQVLLERVYQSCKAFVIRAGTLIFSATILIWAIGYFPGDHTEQFELQSRIEALEAGDMAEGSAEFAQLQTEYDRISADLLETSFLGRSGKWIEPAVKPLGWDWKIGVGAIASFPAREVIIATLGTIYSLGGDSDEDGLISALQDAKWPDGRPVYTLPVALSIMVFFALCAQCVSTLLVIKRETNSWRWPIASFAYMTILAYLGSLLVFQIGSRM